MIKKILGIDRLERAIKRNERQLERIEDLFHQLEDRVAKIENPYDSNKVENDKKEILKQLKKPKTTNELARGLDMHRTWVSHLINQMERKEKVYAKKRRGREIVYAKA